MKTKVMPVILILALFIGAANAQSYSARRGLTADEKEAVAVYFRQIANVQRLSATLAEGQNLPFAAHFFNGRAEIAEHAANYVENFNN